MSTNEIIDLKQTIRQKIDTAKSQLEAIRETHKLLIEFVLQTVAAAKSLETNEDRLALLANGMQEIKKYSEQEIQKYTHDLGSFTGMLQGIDVALRTLDSEPADDTDPEEDVEDENLSPSDVGVLDSE